MRQSLVYKKFIPFKKVTFVKLSKSEGKILAESILGNSFMITVLTKADGFIIVPEEKSKIKEGENVEVHVFP